MTTRRRFDLIPWYAIREASHILHMGLAKHGFETWKEIPARTHIEHAMSHMGYWLDGELLDDESGRSHLQHAVIRAILGLAVEILDSLKKTTLADRIERAKLN